MTRKTLSLLIITTIATSALCACGELKLYQSDKTPVLASVDGVELRESQLPNIFTQSMSTTDSNNVKELYVDQWILKEVKRQEAEKIVAQNDATLQQINKLVEIYRERLLLQALEKEFTTQKLDTTITLDAIEKYYQDHKNRYKLTSPLVKAIVVKLPEGLRQGQRLKEMFLGGDKTQLQDFINICAKNNYTVYDNRETWEPFSTTISRIPLVVKNLDKFVLTNRTYAFNDDGHQYLMRIEKRLPSGSLSPLEIEKDRITVILRNTEKKKLVEKINDSLLHNAQQKGIIRK